VLLFVAPALFLAAACSSEPATPGTAPPSTADGTSHPMVGRPAPDFVVDSLTPGGWLPLAGLRGKPLAMLFLRPGSALAPDLVREFNRFHSDPTLAPTRFMGVIHDSPEAIERFRQAHGITMPILRDPGSTASAYAIGETPTVILLDADHIVRFRLDGYLGREFRPRLEVTEAALRELPSWRIPPARTLLLEYSEYVRMPDFAAKTTDDRRLHLSESRGRIVVLLFLDPDCSWCPSRLPALLTTIRQTGSRDVGALGIVPSNPAGVLTRTLRDSGVEVPIVVDSHRKIAVKLPSIEAPELLILDREGFIRYRAPRDDDDFIRQFRQQLGIVLGEAPPQPLGDALPFEPVLTRVPHVGDDACRGCHPAEYLQWRATRHAAAINPLIQDNRAGDGECTPCHTTGSGLAGGFGDVLATASMTNVQCEVCHGPGADHIVAPQRFKRTTVYGLTRECAACDVERLCIACHDAENDPDFDLATALPLVSH
jgi:peroxiredoxin